MLTEVPDNYIYLFIFNIPKSINPWNISDQQEYIFKQITKCVSEKKGGQGLNVQGLLYSTNDQNP